MHRLGILLCAGLAAATLTSASGAAAAPPTAGKWQLELHATPGFVIGDGEPNVYGVGFGPRVGSTFGPGLWFGSNFDYFLGGSTDAFGSSLSVNAYGFTAELGWDIGVGSAPLAIRPQMGFGLTEFRSCVELGLGLGSTCGSGGTSFSLQPGVSVPVVLGVLLLHPGIRFNLPTEDAIDPYSGMLFDLAIGIAL